MLGRGTNPSVNVHPAAGERTFWPGNEPFGWQTNSSPRGVRGERTEHTKLFSRTLAGFGLTWHPKVHFSTFDGKLELQCIRNGPQNPLLCPGSLRDTFII